MIPFEIASSLRDSLTERGIEWWSSPNRALDGRVPGAVWDRDSDTAAESFRTGDYL